MNTIQICQTIGYTLPTLHKGKTTFISYYVLSLDGKDAIRIRTKLNFIKDVVQRDLFAKKLIAATIQKLESGWTPLLDEEENKSHKIVEALNLYYNTKNREFEMGEIRKDTLRTIKSHVKIFTEWLQAKKLDQTYLVRFSKKEAADYMTYIFLKREATAKTYNNYLLATSTIFNWFITNSMLQENPFRVCKAKPLKNKSQKVVLIKEERTALKNYLEVNNPSFYLACLLLYHCGIRRTELTKIKIQDIDFKNQVINIDHSIAKMNRNRYATLSPEILEYILTLEINKQPGRYFLIGSNWHPSDSAIAPKKLSDEFSKCRKVLNFHPKTTFYSLRKTGGISRAEEGLSIQAIKDFFGHTSLSSAVTYFENHRNKGNQELKQSKDTF